jgi:hypothetical protein
MPQFSLLNVQDPYAIEKLIIRASYITDYELIEFLHGEKDE